MTRRRSRWFVVPAALAAGLYAATAASGAPPPLTAAAFRSQAAAICKATTTAATAAVPALAGTGAPTPLPPLPSIHPKSVAGALASIGSWLKDNSASIASMVKALQKADEPSVIDPRIAPTLEKLVGALRTEVADLARLRPPAAMATRMSLVLYDLRTDLGTWSSLLAKARATKLSFSGVLSGLMVTAFQDGSQEATLWQQLGVPACSAS